VLTALVRPTISSRIAGPVRIWVLVAALALLASIGYATILGPLGSFPAPVSLPWPVLAVCFAVAEIFVIHLEFRADSHSFSLNEVPLVIGLFFLSPGDLLLAQAVGAGSALVFHRRQPLLKLAFNLCNAAIGTSVAIIVFRGAFGLFELAIPSVDVLGPAAWGAAALAVLLTDQLVALNVLLAISLSQSSRVNRRHVITTGTAFALANTCLALAAVTLLWLHPVAVLLPLGLCGVLVVAYNAYAAELRKRKSIDLLVQSTRFAHESAEGDSVTRSLLSRARDMFVAEVAELTVFPQGSEPGTRIVLGPKDEYRRERVASLDPTQGVWTRVASEGRALRLARPISNPTLKSYYAGQGIRDLMAAPLRRDDRVIGEIMVANRRSDVMTFSSDDLDLFETLGNHASVSLQNGRLVDELRQQLAENRHQASHDALTDLPNRTLFHERLQQALAAGQPPAGVGVLVMDLDGFKEVNDTLGHHTGDLLLRQVAQRLLEVLGTDGMVARLSGDEFGILLTGVANPADALASARRILGALDRPFSIEELTLEVGASIGVATCPDHGSDDRTLVQRADVAMYLAKESRSGAEVYSPHRDQHSPARLALAGELRRAIDQGELLVLYQPKVDLHGRVLGAEALVRWQHPERGLITPDEFVPMAEQTGLIRPLTFHVLQQAVAQCRQWRDAGYDVHVAVNLSLRNLLDIELPDGVAAVLQRHALPASCLELEITESIVMADTARAEAVLARLHAMGIGVSIDDFGTGLSSYQRLQRLPVDELKIDRSFVAAMDGGGKAVMIVRSIIDLGHNLGLRVVAEGVETVAVWNQLRMLGCDLAQGYLISRPVSGAAVTEMLETAARRLDPRGDARPSEPMPSRYALTSPSPGEELPRDVMQPRPVGLVRNTFAGGHTVLSPRTDRRKPLPDAIRRSSGRPSPSGLPDVGRPPRV
jgi:diguanylate cyclase (GGDEF)-like protein